MGIWGIRIFENDITCDVKETYERYLAELEDDQAFLKIYEEFLDLIGTEDEPLFWYALALSQWENGRLDQKVKDKALVFIEENGGICRFGNNSPKRRKWEETLRSLRQTLSEPMPPRKIIEKPKKFIQNPWNTGDIYAYKLHNKMAKEQGFANKYVVMQKVGDVEYYKDVVFSVVQVFDGIFDHIPDMREIENLRILPLIDPPGVDGLPNSLSMYVPSFEHFLKATMMLDKPKDYPQAHLTFIGNQEMADTVLDSTSFTDLFWEANAMDNWLIGFHLGWKNLSY